MRIAAQSAADDGVGGSRRIRNYPVLSGPFSGEKEGGALSGK